MKERHFKGGLLGLSGGMGERIEPESRPFLDKFGPKNLGEREERIRVVTGRGKGTFESAGVFLCQDWQSCPERAESSTSGRDIGEGREEEECSLSTYCVPGPVLSCFISSQEPLMASLPAPAPSEGEAKNRPQ